MERKTQINLWYVLLAMLAVIWLREAWVTSQQVEPVPYSQFQKLLEDGNVTEITIRGDLIHGTLKTPLPGGDEVRHDPRADGACERALEVRREVRGYRREHVPARRALVGRAGARVLRPLDVPDTQDGGAPGRPRRRLHVARQKQGEDLRRDRHEDDVRGCCGRGRSEGGARGSRRVPEGFQALRQTRRARPARRAPGGTAGHGENAP